MKIVCILGEGAWGTAVATLLATNGFTVKLWCYDQEAYHAIINSRCNKKYLPDIYLDPTIIPVLNLEDAVNNVTWIFEALPVKFLRTVLSSLKSHVTPDQRWVILSKGIEHTTFLLPSQIVDNVLGYQTNKAVLVGPSYAHDLAKKQITAVTLAASDCDLGLQLQQMLGNSYFRPYLSLDIIGVQIGAALKNVIALAIGMLDGAGYTDNAKAFLLTRGLHEMVVLANHLGGKIETLYGLSGVGDLVLTAMGKGSRNQDLGRQLGKGESLETITKKYGSIPEGINTTLSLYQIIQKQNLDMPICAGIYKILFEKLTIANVITDLMSRPLEQECLPKL